MGLESRKLGNQVVVLGKGLTFKIATEDWEFEQISRLNYETFVEEIPQHKAQPRRILVDRFHDENTYIIGLRDGQLHGMVAVRGKRPFSLDQKLDNLDTYLPLANAVCEVRLLAIDKKHRSGRVLEGLLTMLIDYCIHEGYDLAIVSGSVGQQKLYKRLGLVPFGPLVGSPGAMYQPMFGVPAAIKQEFKAHFSSTSAYAEVEPSVNLLPGPVGIATDVRRAFAAAPVSHRTSSFVEDFNNTKRLLCNLVGSRHAEILMGSGTLANDVVAGQLSLTSGQGVVLSNGEFGERLADHATRAGLSFKLVQVPWGQAFRRDVIEQSVDQSPGITWLWAVHCETSSGILNDLAILKEVCDRRDIRLCLDCISSIGTVPVDLSGVYLTSGVSGKGLGSFPGLSMVFHNHHVAQSPRTLPRYLDLGLLAATNGVAFTVSSNLVYALMTALKRFETDKVFSDIVDVSKWLRSRLRELGFHIVANDTEAAPAVITIELPGGMSSSDMGRRLEEAGYLLSYNSAYLLERNWIQICLMGKCSEEVVTPLLNILRQFCPRHSAAS